MTNPNAIPEEYDLHFAAVMNALGFELSDHHDERCGDDGDAENGPHPWREPALSSWWRKEGEMSISVWVSFSTGDVDMFHYPSYLDEQFWG